MLIILFPLLFSQSLVRCCNVLAHKQQMGFCFKVKSMLAADSCCEKHLHLQTTTFRMYSNMFDVKESSNPRV